MSQTSDDECTRGEVYDGLAADAESTPEVVYNPVADRSLGMTEHEGLTPRHRNGGRARR